MKTALLVIDMQRFFSEMVSPKMMENVTSLVDYFRTGSGVGTGKGNGKGTSDARSGESHSLIIFTQHGHTEEELDTVPSPNQLVRKWGVGGSIRAGSKDWEFLPGIQKLVADAGARVVSSSSSSSSGSSSTTTSPDKDRDTNTCTETMILPKTTYDAFIHTPLEDILRKREIERVVVCGVMTDCCVDTTGRAAFNRGFETWVVKDACGSANERQHRAGLDGFGFAFGDLVDTRDVLRRLEGGKK